MIVEIIHGIGETGSIVLGVLAVFPHLFPFLLLDSMALEIEVRS